MKLSTTTKKTEEVKMARCCRMAVNKGLTMCPKCHQLFMRF